MSSVLTRRRAVPPRIRKVLLIVVGVVVGLLALSFVAGLFAQAHAVREAQKLTWFSDDFRPPASDIVCHGALTPACPAEAARRLAIPVAWTAVPPGYHLQWVDAASAPKAKRGKGHAEELLTGPRDDVILTTQPDDTLWEPGNEQVVGTYSVNGDVIRAYRARRQADVFPDPSITYRWTRDGVPYQLWVTPHYMLDTGPIDPAAFAKLLSSIGYAAPPARHRHQH